MISFVCARSSGAALLETFGRRRREVNAVCQRWQFQGGSGLVCRTWLVLLLGALAILPASAQTGGTIEAIRIEGTQRIEPETVQSYLSVKAGDPFDAERVNQSLKSLFATGLFADVTLRREGNALVVRV